MRELPTRNPDREAMARTTQVRMTEGRNLEDANRYADQASRAASDHSFRLRALEPVFGPAVRAAAEEHLERLTESSSEAIFHLRLVIEAIDGERSDLRAELVNREARIANLERELDRMRELPEIVLERAESYFRRIRRRAPGWLVELRRSLRPPVIVDDEEPF